MTHFCCLDAIEMRPQKKNYYNKEILFKIGWKKATDKKRKEMEI